MRVTFLAVGDIMLSRGVARRMANAGDPLLPFRKFPLLKSTDFNFGNLESPFSGRDRILGRHLTFNTHTRDIAGLAEYNFKVLNLANNHAFDQNLSGLKYTRSFLESHGIAYVGAGDSPEGAWRPVVLTVNGLRIAFIGASYTSFNDGGAARNNCIARIEDLSYLQEAITRMKSEADFIIVTMHAGTEYVATPNPSRALDREQIRFAHAAVDYGADMVIGTHPHWIQNHEVYSGKLIFYSLGNFIFDMRDPVANEGLVLKITLRGEKRARPSTSDVPGEEGAHVTARVEAIECLPVIIENYSTPRLASPAEASKILKRSSLPQRIIDPN